MSIRAFLAVVISEEARQGVARLRDRVEKGVMFTGAQPSWVRLESMHLTIKFLGNIEESAVEKISARLGPACAALSSFVYGVRGLGVFPSPRQPRVLWVGIKKADEEFKQLHQTVEAELSALGFERDERPFHPHLTLARVRSLKGAAQMMKIVADNGREWCGECKAERLIFFQSQLHPSGAIYTKLREFPFEGPPKA